MQEHRTQDTIDFLLSGMQTGDRLDNQFCSNSMYLWVGTIDKVSLNGKKTKLKETLFLPLLPLLSIDEVPDAII